MLQEKLDEVKAVMLNGEEMKSRCRDDEVVQLTSKLLQLHRQTCSTVSKANAVQVHHRMVLHVRCQSACGPESVFHQSRHCHIYRLCSLVILYWHLAGACCLQSNFEEHVRNVLRFHASLDEHVHWLGSTETALSGFRHPSKLVDKVEQQIAKHEVKTTASLCHSR